MSKLLFLIIYYLKNQNYIAYTLAILILFPSCIVINKSKHLPIEETTKYNNRRIKIKTLDGNKYKVKWIEEKDDDIVSITNTKKILMDTSKIKKIRAGNGWISLDSAFNHNGVIQIVTKNKTHNLLNIEAQDDLIRGVKRTNRDTLTVVIPKDQIKKIKVKNNATSAVVTFVIVGIVVTSGMFAAFSSGWGG
ncbi:MAG: hypothetical protein KAI99_00260 [Cyclobacteriaceae bacterium]|nr:hypothetical protein [Cyclobacteriaceae bacterium]MCK5280249.1 hypothetical protein [Cyclobacteriaceae bacterium]MCK5466898.1 hypothetical protein [Cyclobacteriaceae bacterium]MCK5704671.1 hypothetical protein [Cyclobacteriaceae bacterium]